MGEIIEIYGTEIPLPEQPHRSLIEDWGERDPKKQYWRRGELPDYMLMVLFDDEGFLQLDDHQKEFAQKELDRIDNGFWFFNNGKPTYITGKCYFYFKYWTLEDGNAPEYRSTIRRWFLFLDFWEKVLWCLGIVRGKKRREGATSEAASNLVYEAIRIKNSRCGIISKKNKDAKDAFTDKVTYGFRNLPLFLQPTLMNAKDSQTELHFAIPVKSTKLNRGKRVAVVEADGGMNSKINYQPTALNSYDSGRLTRLLFDEGGKWPVDVPASIYLGIVKKTLVKGGIRVGFAEVPSTVNEMTKKGGAEYKKIWVGANQFAKDFDGQTPNLLVRYFCPAYDGYEGYIDQYGESIIDTPTAEQKLYVKTRYGLDITVGAKQHLLNVRKKLKDEDLEEEIRMNPFNEIEMFMSANTECEFNSMKINAQVQYLEENPIPTRQVRFFRKDDESIDWVDDPNGFWHIVALPPEGLANAFLMEGRLRKPGNKSDYVLGIDGYSNSQGGTHGSKGSGFIYRKLNPADPANTGLFVAMFYGRPRSKQVFHEQLMFAAEFYGCEACYEFNSDDYLSYYSDRGRIRYLMRTPLSTIDPLKRQKEERVYGVKATNAFSLTKQLDTMVAYVENFCDKIYFPRLLEQLLEFDSEDRTKSDAVVAAMIALVSALDVSARKQDDTGKKKSFVKSYKTSKYSTNGRRTAA